MYLPQDTMPPRRRSLRTVPRIRTIMGWIIEHDRQFRSAQARIDSLTSRF